MSLRSTRAGNSACLGSLGSKELRLWTKHATRATWNILQPHLVVGTSCAVVHARACGAFFGAACSERTQAYLNKRRQERCSMSRQGTQERSK